MTPRALLSLLFNGSKAIDAVQAAYDLGLLSSLPASLGVLSDRFGLVPMRLYKLMDCLECVGFVTRVSSDTLADTEYFLVPGVLDAVAEVLGPGSQERDRDTYPWRRLHGQLPAVLRGTVSMPSSAFEWPPSGAQVAAFEKSMTAGLGPIIESFRSAALFSAGDRMLDVGGGDGSLAVALLESCAGLHVDVYNLPAVEPLVPVGPRLGFVGGDFLASPLPSGYSVLSFVRVLHDWEPAIARSLLAKAYEALPSDGRVLICEEFRDSERLAKQFFWSYFLIGVDSCASLLREVSWYERVLGEIGFSSIEVLPGPFEIVVATRP